MFLNAMFSVGSVVGEDKHRYYISVRNAIRIVITVLHTIRTVIVLTTVNDASNAHVIPSKFQAVPA